MAKRKMPRFVKILAAAWSGAEDERIHSESRLTRVEHFAHFWALVWRSFVQNRCLVRASALSYTTLLALIPLLAVAISVTSSLLKSEGEEKIYEVIDKFVSNVMPPETASVETAPMDDTGGDTRVIDAQKIAAKRIHDFVQNTRSGTLGVTGMIVLVFIAISMLSRIEATFNDIWGVTRGRSWVNRVVLYWATITLGPLLFACALGLSSGAHFEYAKSIVTEMPLIGGFIFQLLPLFVLWFAFAMIYRLVPHTKVHFSAALVGGFIGGSLWHLNNVFGFLYVSRVISNSKIYGSLGLVPVFMAGLYMSWLILLFGAQVAYAFQNRKAYLQEKLVENVNQRGREFIALRLMTCIGQRFQNGRPPIALPEISAELDIPSKLAQQVLQPLIAARLVTEIAGMDSAYAPARPLETINAHHVLRSVRVANGQELPFRENPVRAEVYGEFARIEEAERAAASSITMLELVNRAQAKLELPAPSAKEISENEKLSSADPIV